MRKIFIVEDDSFILAIFSMFIRDLGHEIVGQTGDGLKAIEMCKELKPDVVLMDIHLEGDIDGIKTANLLTREIDIPIIFVTGETSSSIIERAIVPSTYGYLVKPINKKELGIAIDLAFYKHKVDIQQKQREKSYREFISESPLPIIVINDNKISYVNKHALNNLRTTYIEDVITNDIKNYFDSKSLKLYENAINNISNNIIEPFRAIMKTQHGDLFHTEITGSMVMFNNRNSIQLIIRKINIKDDDECKNKIYKESLFKSHLSCIMLDSDLHVIDLNYAAFSMLGIENNNNIKLTDILDKSTQIYNLNANEITSKYKDKIIELTFKNGNKSKFNLYTKTCCSETNLQILLVENKK